MNEAMLDVTIAFTDGFPEQCSETDFQQFLSGNIKRLIERVRGQLPTAVIEWDGNYTATMAVLKCNNHGHTGLIDYFQKQNCGKILNISA